MRVLQIGADRSVRGILYRDSPAFIRQEAYAKELGNLDIIGFSLSSDGAHAIDAGALRVFPTNSASKLLWGFDAARIGRRLPKPDVISVQDPFEVGLVGLLMARAHGVPLHVQVHTDFLSPAYARLSLTNRIRVWIAGFVLFRATRIRVVSWRVKKSIQSRYNVSAPITVLPIFVDVSRFRNAQPISEEGFSYLQKTYTLKVLLVSRIGAEKNIALGVDAFKHAAPESACLIVVGEVSTDLVEKAKPPVYLVGSQDVAAMYKSVDLVLVPSKYAGYGLVIVEELAAGKPVISTDVGIAREAGAIITDESHFAGALKQWFTNGPREASLKNYSYENFEQYVQSYRADIKACADSQKKE